MKSRPIQALESNLGSRFCHARVVLAGSGTGKADRIPAPRAARLTLAIKPYGPGAGCDEHAHRYTRAAMCEPVCGLQLKMGRTAAFAASTPAGTQVQRSRRVSIVGSTDDCHISHRSLSRRPLAIAELIDCPTTRKVWSSVSSPTGREALCRLGLPRSGAVYPLQLTAVGTTRVV
jgi:hypothetical protein